MLQHIARSLLISTLIPLSSIAATIQLPQTGQTGCWDVAGNIVSCTGTGQDGASKAGASWPTPRFSPPTQTQTDCVEDNLTGLWWVKDRLAEGIVSWQDALSFVDNINSGTGMCGQTDWRLPNRSELLSLVNFQQVDSAVWLNTVGFQRLNTNFPLYWSSSSSAIDGTTTAWNISLADGTLDSTSDKSSQFNVMLVRDGLNDTVARLPKTGQITSYASWDDGWYKKGIAWPTPRFASGTGTVTDNLTGLVWSANANAPGAACNPGVAKTWQGALDYVACLNQNVYLGYRSWRLPNALELNSLLDISADSPALVSGYFTGVQNNVYWSSTTNVAYPGNAISVDMTAGNIVINDKNAESFVWPLVGTLSLSPVSTTFPATLVGSQSASKTFTIMNGGGASTAVTSISIAGTSADQFSVVTGGSNPCTSLTPTLAVGQSCTVNVSFVPSSVGAKAVELQVVSNDPVRPVSSATLSGTSYALVNGVCGSSNGQVFASEPTANLCSSGDPGEVLQLSGKWSWGCYSPNGGTNSSCSADIGYSFAVTVAGTGGGSVTSSPAGFSCNNGTCSVVFASGTLLVLTATHDAASSFSGWTDGACSGTATDCNLTMNANKSTTASFAVVPRARVGSTPYGLLSNAYSVVGAGGTIESKAVPFAENLMLNRAINFTLNGGYDDTYSSRTGYTELDGVFTVNSGSVVIDRLIVK